jgi:hypothetical protein
MGAHIYSSRPAASIHGTHTWLSLARACGLSLLVHVHLKPLAQAGRSGRAARRRRTWACRRSALCLHLLEPGLHLVEAARKQSIDDHISVGGGEQLLRTDLQHRERSRSPRPLDAGVANALGEGLVPGGLDHNCHFHHRRLGFFTDWRPPPATAPPFSVSPLENAPPSWAEAAAAWRGATRNRGRRGTGAACR